PVHGAIEFPHYFPDNDGTILVTVHDEAGDVGTDSFCTEDNVTNIAPYATLVSGFDSTTDEFTATLADPFDPSSVDMQAGLRYCFATDYSALTDQYDQASGSLSAQFSFDESG